MQLYKIENTNVIWTPVWYVIWTVSILHISKTFFKYQSPKRQIMRSRMPIK